MTYHTKPLDHVFLREGTTYIKIPIRQIDFIQADGNYAYLQAGDRRFAVKRSLAAITEELNAPDFVRISRGVLVNFSRVSKISFASGQVQLAEHTLKMGKAYHAEVKSRMPRL